MLGDNIKTLREKKDMTQEELCKSLNITQSALSHWELGRRQPNVDQLIKLADFFGVSLDYLTGRYK